MERGADKKTRLFYTENVALLNEHNTKNRSGEWMIIFYQKETESKSA